MKKQIFALSAALMLAFGSFAFANTLKNDVSSTPANSGGEDDALYCKVSNGTTTIECWFCNCAELRKAL